MEVFIFCRIFIWIKVIYLFVIVIFYDNIKVEIIKSRIFFKKVNLGVEQLFIDVIYIIENIFKVSILIGMKMFVLILGSFLVLFNSEICNILIFYNFSQVVECLSN